MDLRLHALAYSGLGWLAIHSQDWPKARDMFAKSVELNPESGENLLLLAQLEEELGHPQASAQALKTWLCEGMPRFHSRCTANTNALPKQTSPRFAKQAVTAIFQT